MNCEQLQETLVAYLDIKAQPSERRQVEAHLSQCAACRNRAEEFQLLWGVLDELPAVLPSPAFDAAVRARVAQEPRRAGFWNWARPSPRLAFAGTALVVLSLWLSSSVPPARQPVATVVPQGSEAEFRMIKDLPVLEDYDVLADFDALSDLSVPSQAAAQPVHPQM
jgi:anti-sigma factor RsiW